jgi:hypothetical protein
MDKYPDSILYRNVIPYVIPGALLILTLRWFLDGFVGMNLTPWDAGGVGGAALLIFGSWVFGYLVQVCGVWLLSKLYHLESRLPSQLLEPSDSHLTPEFKTEFGNWVRKVLGLSPENAEVYPLCAAFVQSRPEGRVTERQASLHGLVRGLLAIVKIVLTASVLVVGKQLLLALLPALNIVLPVTGFVTFDESNLIVGILLLVMSVVSLRLLGKFAAHTAELVVENVYRSFYVACHSKPE